MTHLFRSTMVSLRSRLSINSSYASSAVFGFSGVGSGVRGAERMPDAPRLRRMSATFAGKPTRGAEAAAGAGAGAEDGIGARGGGIAAGGVDRYVSWGMFAGIW